MKYFKINKRTKLHRQMDELWDNIKKAKQATADLCKEVLREHNLLSAFEEEIGWYEGGHVVSGGFRGIVFTKDFPRPPEGWAELGSRFSARSYYPKKRENKEFWKKVKDLPRVQNDDVNKLLNYKWTMQGMRVYGIPEIRVGKNGQHLFVIKADPKGGYTIPKGAVEILGSEFEKLKG